MNRACIKENDKQAKTIVEKLLKNQAKTPVSKNHVGQAFAPTNIALCKYWGKRNEELNLPMTNSLSISLGRFGAHTKISELNREDTEDAQDIKKAKDPKGSIISTESNRSPQANRDILCVNGEAIENASYPDFQKKVSVFLDLFRPTPRVRYRMETEVNIPIAAGLASSACGFAALVMALKALYGWKVSNTELSMLARLGSGSASRSLWKGFVEWEKGEKEDGMDSVGHPLETIWPELRVGLLVVDQTQKYMSSRNAMQKTKETSLFYSQWPHQVQRDLSTIKSAIEHKDFIALGETAESNAQAMHALMMTARPSIVYSSPETLALKYRVWELRKEGTPIYFTQDAGPNLKLLFLKEDQSSVLQHFPTVTIIEPFHN